MDPSEPIIVLDDDDPPVHVIDDGPVAPPKPTEGAPVVPKVEDSGAPAPMVIEDGGTVGALKVEEEGTAAGLQLEEEGTADGLKVDGEGTAAGLNELKATDPSPAPAPSKAEPVMVGTDAVATGVKPAASAPGVVSPAAAPRKRALENDGADGKEAGSLDGSGRKVSRVGGAGDVHTAGASSKTPPKTPAKKGASANGAAEPVTPLQGKAAPGDDHEVSDEEAEFDLSGMRMHEYEQVAKFGPAQQQRYEQYRRSDLKKEKIKKVLAAINPILAKASDPFFIAVKGLAKVFVGDVVETALEYRDQCGETGPLQPKHMREAHRRLRSVGGIPSPHKRSRAFN